MLMSEYIAASSAPSPLTLVQWAASFWQASVSLLLNSRIESPRKTSTLWLSPLSSSSLLVPVDAAEGTARTVSSTNLTFRPREPKRLTAATACSSSMRFCPDRDLSLLFTSAIQPSSGSRKRASKEPVKSGRSCSMFQTGSRVLFTTFVRIHGFFFQAPFASFRIQTCTWASQSRKRCASARRSMRARSMRTFSKPVCIFSCVSARLWRLSPCAWSLKYCWNFLWWPLSMLHLLKKSFERTPSGDTICSATACSVPKLSRMACSYFASSPLSERSVRKLPMSWSRAVSSIMGNFHETETYNSPVIFLLGSALSSPMSLSPGREGPFSASSLKSAFPSGKTMSFMRGPKVESGGSQASPKKSLATTSESQTSRRMDC
mmetsp:Transcript_89055/g.278972  ORF Transcript_89055/g.278972 Transcript_89055/m.278972 type:complete len:376 (-) Transcript_89055:151-1278(-)